MIIEMKLLLQSIAVVLFIETTASIMITAVKWPYLPVLALVRLLEIISLIALITRKDSGLAVIGLGRKEWPSGLKRGIIWSGFFGLSALLGYFILQLFHVSPWPLIRTTLPQRTLSRVIFFMAGGLIAPVAEEIFFRGIIYGFLRRWGILTALFGSTVMFVLLHGIAGGMPIVQIVGGIVFALSYEIEKKLLVPMTIHILGNMVIFLLSLAAI